MVVAENTMEQRLLEAEAAAERLRRECAESATRVADLEARLAERATCPGTQAVEELIKMREERARALLDGVDAERHALGHKADALDAELVRVRGELDKMAADWTRDSKALAEAVERLRVEREEHGATRRLLGFARAEAAEWQRKLAEAEAALHGHLVERPSDLAGLAAREAHHVEDRTPKQQAAALAAWRADPPHVVRTEAPGEVVSVEVRRAEQEAAHLRAKLATAEQEISKLRADLDDVLDEAAHVEEGLSRVDAADLDDLRTLATQVVEAWDRSDREKMIQAVAMLRELSDADDPPEPPEMFQARPPRPLPPVSTGEHVQRYVEAMAPTVETPPTTTTEQREHFVPFFTAGEPR